MYILTPDNLTFFLAGRPVTVPRSHKNFDAILYNVKLGDNAEVDLEALINPPRVWESFTGGRIKVSGRDVLFDGEPVVGGLADKIADFVAAGQPELAEPLCNFLDRIQANPSFRARKCLYNWLSKSKLPILNDGRVIAWKIVGENFRDIHSGKFDNSPGKVVEVPRHDVDDDFNVACSHGLHVCSDEYLPHYGTAPGNHVVMVAVDPADFVAVPADYNFAKARVCKYEVLVEVPREQCSHVRFAEARVVEAPTRPTRVERVLGGNANGIVVVLSEDGNVQQFFPTDDCNWDSAYVGADGNVWFADPEDAGVSYSWADILEFARA